MVERIQQNKDRILNTNAKSVTPSLVYGPIEKSMFVAKECMRQYF